MTMQWHSRTPGEGSCSDPLSSRIPLSKSIWVSLTPIQNQYKSCSPEKKTIENSVEPVWYWRSLTNFPIKFIRILWSTVILNIFLNPRTPARPTQDPLSYIFFPHRTSADFGGVGRFFHISPCPSLPLTPHVKIAIRKGLLNYSFDNLTPWFYSFCFLITLHYTCIFL